MPEAACISQRTAAPEPLTGPPVGWIPASSAADILRVTPKTVKNRILFDRTLVGRLCLGATGPTWFVDPASDPRLNAVLNPTAPPQGDNLPAGRDVVETEQLRRLTDKQRGVLAARYRAVSDWLAYRKTLGDAADVMTAFYCWSATHAATVGRHKAVSWSTMWTWVKNYQADGLAGLAPNWLGRQCDGEPTPAAWSTFTALYLDQRHRRSYMDCWRQTGEQAKRMGWKWISYQAARRKLLDETPAGAICLAREGEKAYADKFAQYAERDYTTIEPNEIWVGDHHQLDVACINPETGKPDFAWITTWFDMRTRKVMGVAFSFNPNTQTIIDAFRDAVLRYGCPEVIYIDNGKDYRCVAFSGGKRRNTKLRVEHDVGRLTSMAASLKVEPMFCLPYNAQSKNIERWHRTIGMQFCRQWETYRGRKPEDRPEGLQEILTGDVNDGRIPEAKTLEAAFRDYCENDYGNAAHTGHAMAALDGRPRSPNEAWADLAYKGRVPMRSPSREELVLCLRRTTKPYQVQRNGIAPFGRDAGWWMSPLLLSMHGQKVFADFDPDDLAQIHIYSLKGQFLCVASNARRLHARHGDVTTVMKNKRAAARQMAAYQQSAELQLADDPIAAAQRRREATQREASERAARKPTPPGGDGESAASRKVIPFRTALAETVAALKRAPKAVGMEASMETSSGDASPLHTLRLETGETVNIATGEVLPSAECRRPSSEPSAADLMDALNV